MFQPNRDTLAYLIVHLQSVAANYRENKMNVDNLATVMGPTILGNSSNDPMAIMSEAGVQKAVVRALMAISEVGIVLFRTPTTVLLRKRDGTRNDGDWFHLFSGTSRSRPSNRHVLLAEEFKNQQSVAL